MSTDLPPLDARVRAQEYMQTVLHARLEEIAGDMQLSFKQLADYQLQMEHKIDHIEARVARIEENMVTKEDLKNELAAMESRILGAFQQLVDSLGQAGDGETK